MNRTFAFWGIQVSTIIVAILAGLIGYFAATQVIAVLLASVLGIGIGWIPDGIIGIIVRSIIAIFMTIFCGKNFKKWFTNKLNY